MKFVETVYGKDTLEENLQFIADALDGNGASREIIRNYFLKDFFADHCKMYQKRPIYWLFDSGKNNGFKALVYMHRYEPDLLARMRTDYVHEQQSRYRTAIEDIGNRLNNATGSERVQLSKKLGNLTKQSDEIHAYEEKIHHLADQYIAIDLDDGVKVNYAKFQDVLAKINDKRKVPIMAVLDAEQVTKDLNGRFAAPLKDFYQRRIIFWKDEEQEFIDKLDELSWKMLS